MDGRIGLAYQVTSASQFVSLTEKLENYDIIDVSNDILIQKSIKSPWEITQIQMATKQADTIFSEMGEHIRPGITELELSASLETRLRKMGHPGTVRIRTGADLGMIATASGEAALYPTNFDGPVGGEGPFPSSPPGPGWKEIAQDETVIVDVVTSHNGYHSDNSRTFFLGNEIPDTVQKAHAFCIDVLKQLEKRLRPGAICSDIYNDVQAEIGQDDVAEGFMGFGDNRVRFFGHGVGLELDEYPIIANNIDLMLKQNMVVAVEPNAFLQGVGPVGIENTYQITEEGCESLVVFPYDIVCL